MHLAAAPQDVIALKKNIVKLHRLCRCAADAEVGIASACFFFFFGIWLIWQGYPLHRQAQLEGVLWYIHSMNFEKGRGKGKSKNSSDRLDYLEAEVSQLQRAVAEKGQTRTAEELHRLCATG